MMGIVPAVAWLVLSGHVLVAAPAVTPAAPSATLTLPAQALVTEDDVRVRSGPSKGSVIVGIVHRNQLVTVEERKPEWFRMKSEWGAGWVAASYLQFDLPTPLPDPLEADSGGMDWFYARFGEGTSYLRVNYTDKSLSIAEYRILIKEAESGDERTQIVLRNSLFALLAAKPDDPRFALFRQRVFSQEFVFGMLRICQSYPWLVDAMPKGWWTANRLVEMTCTVSGQCGYSAVTAILAKNPELLASLDISHWVRVVNAAKRLNWDGGEDVLLERGLYPAVTRRSVPPNMRYLKDKVLSDAFVFRLLDQPRGDWVIRSLPIGWWTRDRILAFVDHELPQGATYAGGPFPPAAGTVMDAALAREKPGPEIFSLDDYRGLLKKVGCGRAGSAAFSILCGTILPYLKAHPEAKRYSSLKERLYSRSVWMPVFECGPDFYKVLSLLPPGWLSRGQVLALMESGRVSVSEFYVVLPPEFQRDRGFVLEILGRGMRPPPEVLAGFSGDREIVLRAVGVAGVLLRYASLELRNDREVVRAAVQSEDCAIRFASKELQEDEEFKTVAERCKAEYGEE